MRAPTLLVTLALLASSASAFTVEEYLRDRASGSAPRMNGYRVYLSGVGEGLAWANAELRVKAQGQLYCEPENLTLNSDNYLQMLDGEISRFSAGWSEPQKRERFAEFRIAQLLTDALMRTFPCKR